VRDRNAEALPRLLDQAALDPVRPTGGQGRDDDLVGREVRQRVLDRQQWIGVSDRAAGGDAALRQGGDREVEAALCEHAGLVDIRDPMAQA
jgi:hypothetical protein